MVIQPFNVKINNLPVADGIQVSDRYPTISWEYDLVDRVEVSGTDFGIIEELYQNGEYSVNIQIGRSQNYLGTDLFNPDVIDYYSVSNEISWRYRGPSLRRGITYYVQLKLTDSDGNESEWYSFNFAYNALPTVSNLVITPSSPSVHDDLSLSYTFFDELGDEEDGTTIRWFVNGVYRKQFDNLLVIPSKYLVFEDEWSAQIFPKDGKEFGQTAETETVSISAQTPIVTNAKIKPLSPSYNDPLYAEYIYTSPEAKPDESQFKWYVNGILQEETTSFVRLQTEVGDIVKYEIRPSDGDISGSWVSSNEVVISEPSFDVQSLFVDGDETSFKSPLTPTLSWKTSGPNRQYNNVRILIGTATGSSNVLNVEINTSLSTYTIPSNTLENGIDYYATVYVGEDGTYGKSKTVQFRTQGSLWDSVSNSAGWTAETICKINAPDINCSGSSSSSSSTCPNPLYQGIKFADGTRQFEIRIFQEKIQLVAGTTIEYSTDNTVYFTLTIVASGTTVKIYKDYLLILNGSDINTVGSTDRFIEIGNIGPTGDIESYFINFLYTINGAHEPSSSSYFDLAFSDYYVTDGSVDWIDGESENIYYSVSNSASKINSTVFKLNDSQKPETLSHNESTESHVKVNGIFSSPNGSYTYFCHDNGVTVFQGRPRDQYLTNNDFRESSNLDDWQITRTNQSEYSFNNGLNINTISGGKVYFSQRERGSKWFDNISSQDGWTVEFELDVSDLTDDNTSHLVEGQEGVGLYINDGSHEEVIWFYENHIWLKHANLYINYDTSLSEYVICGKEKSIKLFARKGSGEFAKLADIQLSFKSTREGNGYRPDVTENNGILYAVWHDDGDKNKTIYFSQSEPDEYGFAIWSSPVQIVNENYDCTNPTIAVYNNDVFIAYEINRSDNTDIGMIVKNQFGWSKPFTFDSGQFPSLSPKITAAENGLIHVVWEDHRSGYSRIAHRYRDDEGKWSNTNFISAALQNALRPSIDRLGENVFISYTQRNLSTNITDVYVIGFDGSNYDSPVKISNSVYEADFSDIVCYNGYIYVVWHDNLNDNYEIFGAILNSQLTIVNSAKQLTSDSQSSRFPRIGVRDTSDENAGNIFVVFESGGELSPYDSSGFVSDITSISGLIYDQTEGWLSSNQGEYDIAFLSDDLRQSRRPAIPKRISSYTHILYETEKSTIDDEYLSYKDLFTNISDAVWDWTYDNIYSLADVEKDLTVSAQKNRREIRFGDFSNTHSADVDFKYIRIIAENNEPFTSRILKQGTKSNVAIVNDSGDAWIGTENGLIFYAYSSNTISELQSENMTGNISSIAIDENNIMYVVSDSTLYASHNHHDFYEPFEFMETVVSACVSPGVLWATGNSNIYKIKPAKFVENLPRNEEAFTAYVGVEGTDYSIFEVDENTELRKIFSDNTGQSFTTTNNGIITTQNTANIINKSNSAIPSNSILDISIVNSAIRYIATSDGAGRMVGSSFEPILFNAFDWTNINSICAVGDIVWASGRGYSYLIRRNKLNGQFSYTSFGSPDLTNYEDNCAKRRRFEFDQSLEDHPVEVFVNGSQVYRGYQVYGNSLVFDSELLDSDTVKVVLRSDLEEFATLKQNEAEELTYGKIFKQLTNFTVEEDVIYGCVNGEVNHIVKYDINDDLELPFDKITLDTTPPVGELNFIEQTGPSSILLRISDYFDNLSGIKDMIVSNYPNLTSDGETPLGWSIFDDEIIFNLGTDFGNIYTQLIVDDCELKRIVIFNNSVFVGASNPSRIYKINFDKSWTHISTIADDATIEFMIAYKNTLFAGIYENGGSGLWGSADGVSWEKKIAYPGKVYCAGIFNNKLYIGTGGNSGGQLFSFDGSNSSLCAESVGSAIYSIATTPTEIYLGTGEGGVIYKYNDITEKISLVTRDKDTQISAMGWANVLPATPNVSNPPPDLYVFAGTGIAGRIIKSVNGGPFNASLTATPTKVTQLKQDTDGILYAAVGKNLYKYKNRSWTIVYSNDLQIEDIAFDQTGFYLVSESYIKRINKEKDKKTIYLALRDVAGNVSDELITTEIDINDLEGFVHSNKILELDENGEVIWTYGGDDNFYSAEKIILEQAEYYSEIFNGGGDHVTWDEISWDALVPDNTDLTVSVRVADSREEILSSKFEKTFTKEEFRGGDLSNLGGQFIQFKIYMNTSERGVSPKLYKVTIRSRARTSVHFFTTNFVLPSTVKGGILTATTFTPLASDIIFGINTSNSINWSDYTIIEKDKLFKLDGPQGSNLRVGVKLISPLGISINTDTLDEYDPYLLDTWNNVISFTYENTDNEEKVIQFRIEIYEDPDFSDSPITTIYSGTNPTVFAVNGEVITSEGYSIESEGIAEVLVALKGVAAIRCNQFYYTKVFVNDGETDLEIDNSHAFISNCYTNYVNEITFDFTNESESANSFGFRVMYFSDPTRTQHVKTFSSNIVADGWLADGSPISQSGIAISPGQSVGISFQPEDGEIDSGEYYLKIDYFDGTEFLEITKSPSIIVNRELTEYCGEYSNVPIMKDLAISFDLVEFEEQFGSKTKTRHTVQLNRSN